MKRRLAKKRFFVLTIVLVLMIIFVHSFFSDDSTESAKQISKTSSFPQTPTNNVIVDDNFSNLQLNDFTKPVYDKYTIWERQAENLPMALPPLNEYSNEKIAYLTFDDGPDDRNTPIILDILKNYGIKATFYVCGNMVEAYPEVLKRIYVEGHAIGNHSYNHNYKDLYPDAEKFLMQISKTDEIIKSVIGVRPLIIRTPGGRAGMWTADYEPMMNACGYVEHDWNVSVEDATSKRPTAQDMIRFVDEQTNTAHRKNASIILLHSNKGKENSAAALPGIIEVLVKKGYKFGVVTPMTPQPW